MLEPGKYPVSYRERRRSSPRRKYDGDNVENGKITFLLCYGIRIRITRCGRSPRRRSTRGKDDGEARQRPTLGFARSFPVYKSLGPDITESG